MPIIFFTADMIVRKAMWCGGMMVRTLDMTSWGREFKYSLRQDCIMTSGHTCASVVKQYNFLLAMGWWCSVVGKVTKRLGGSNGSISLGGCLYTRTSPWPDVWIQVWVWTMGVLFAFLLLLFGSSSYTEGGLCQILPTIPVFCTSIELTFLFSSLAVLKWMVGHTMDVLLRHLCLLSFWSTLPRGVLSTSWCCPSRPCVVFLTYVHLALFLALSLSPGNSLVFSWCDHSMLVSLLWQCLTVPASLRTHSFVFFAVYKTGRIYQWHSDGNYYCNTVLMVTTVLVVFSTARCVSVDVTSATAQLPLQYSGCQ